MAAILTAAALLVTTALLVRTSHSLLGGGPTDIPVASVARVSRRAFGSFVKATGVVRPEPTAEVRLGVQAPGVLKKLHVRLGDHVEKGQLLAEIDSRKLRARHEQATAALRSAEASARFETSNLVRKRALAAEQVIAPNELDVAERTEELARASVAEAEANLEFVRAEISESRVIAPMGGIVAVLAAAEGETLSPASTGPAVPSSAPGFLTILDLDRLELWAFVDETDIGKIELGQDVRFTVDAYPGVEIDGKVVSLRPKPEIRDNVVNYITLIRFTPPRVQTLRPEMTASVRIFLQRRENALSVPRKALHRAQGRAYVFAPQTTAGREKGDPVKRYVTAGSCDEAGCEIVDGLGEGDLVSLGGAQGHEAADNPVQTE